MIRLANKKVVYDLAIDASRRSLVEFADNVARSLSEQRPDSSLNGKCRIVLGHQVVLMIGGGCIRRIVLKQTKKKKKIGHR